MLPEAWLRGPIEGIDPLIMPAAHALVQAREELEEAVAPLNASELWIRPGGAASIGFHLTHIAGSIDRLITYARGEALTETQRKALEHEQETHGSPDDAALLMAVAQEAIDKALDYLQAIEREELLETREVGRRQLPSNVLGLLFHLAEHTQRHTGQIITTARVVRGLGLAAF